MSFAENLHLHCPCCLKPTPQMYHGCDRYCFPCTHRFEVGDAIASMHARGVAPLPEPVSGSTVKLTTEFAKIKKLWKASGGKIFVVAAEVPRISPEMFLWGATGNFPGCHGRLLPAKILTSEQAQLHVEGDSLSGYAAIFKEQDRFGHVLEEHAFKQSLNHLGSRAFPLFVGRKRVGEVVEFCPDTMGLRFQAHLDHSADQNHGVALFMSPVLTRVDRARKITYIKEAKLLQMSLVPM